MAEKPKGNVYPHGLRDEFPNGPPTVVIRHWGCELVLRFAPEDFTGAGPPDEVWLRPDTKKLTPFQLRKFVPRVEQYLEYARANMNIFGPEGTPKERIERARRAAEDVRSLSGPGRGLPPGFFRDIAAEYEALLAEGQPYPVKAISLNHNVVISAASHWIKECRRRDLLPPKPKKEKP